MDAQQADRLIRFANQHDDGALPRAYFEPAVDGVVVRSTALHADGNVSFVLDTVRSLGELRDVLGY